MNWKRFYVIEATQLMISRKILFYGGEFGYGFSNFSAFDVVWQHTTWMTSEHAYQAAKFDEEEIVQEIQAARSPHDALKLASVKFGSEVRDTWNVEEKLRIMYDVISHKHDQHPLIQLQLKLSGDAELIENSHKDSFWGRGPDWKGSNHLGRLWMKLREEKIGTSS